MDLVELRQLMGSILAIEDAEPVDWKLVEEQTEHLYARVEAEPDTVVPELVDHFLADADIRQRDVVYARRQRDELRHFVQTGEYLDSTPVPKWACLLTVAVMLGLVAWVAF